MFITKEVVLAHGKPEGDVNKMGVSLVCFMSRLCFRFS